MIPNGQAGALVSWRWSRSGQAPRPALPDGLRSAGCLERTHPGACHGAVSPAAAGARGVDGGVSLVPLTHGICFVKIPL